MRLKLIIQRETIESNS